MSTTQPSWREIHVDALRGFALLGIVIVNSAAMASAWYGSGTHDPAFSQPLDELLRRLVSALFETKFYLLFSFLFGYSFTLQMASAEREGASFLPRYFRRLGGLALFGIAHAALLFQGDILLTYALLGLLLLAGRNLRPSTASRLAICLLLAAVAGWSALAWLASLQPQHIDFGLLHTQAAAITEAYRQSPASVVAQHLCDIRDGVAFVLLFVQAPCALACFLFGLAAGKSGAMNRLAASPALLRRHLAWTAGIGLFGALAYVQPALHDGSEHRALWALVIDLATAPFLTAAWTLGMLLLFRSGPGRHLQSALAPAGRLALTHYLGQSLVGALVFTGWGWARIGHWSPLATLLFAVGLWMLQVLLSRYWLRRFAYGPAEWLLRAVTLWRLPAIRRPLPGSHATT